MNVHDWNPAKGDACQGDVYLFRIPDSIPINTKDEILPRDNKLILAEGEVTGHHHAIWMKYTQITHFHDEALARAESAKIEDEPIAKLYRDPAAIRALVQAGELTTNDLAIGILVIENAPMVLRHDEHDAIRIPPGRFYVGAQREWDAAQERRVAD